MTAYYNEIDPYAAKWLRNLIAGGHIAAGEVDERSIADVRPIDLKGFRQCHFFAGIGIWSASLRRAGWPDERRVWTGSCPCQPFSQAGKGDGFDDERHLWPHWHWLISQCRPGIVFGEQVASPDGLRWFDLVSSDLEGTSYQGWVADLCSAGIGAPHIRQRLHWLAYAKDGDGRSGECGSEAGARPDGERRRGFASGNAAGALALPDNAERRTDDAGGNERDRQDTGRSQDAGDVEGRGGACVLADADGGHAGAEGLQRGGEQRQRAQDDGAVRLANSGIGHNRGPELDGPGPTNGFWRTADWLFCRDGKWRPVEPGTSPLAHGLPSGMGALGAELSGLAKLAGLDGKSLKRAKAYRLGTLKGYGNAVNEELTAAFINAAGGALEIELSR